MKGGENMLDKKTKTMVTLTGILIVTSILLGMVQLISADEPVYTNY